MIIFQSNRIPFAEYKKLESFVSGNNYLQDILDFLDRWNDETVSVIQVPTSGSTGSPKTINLSKSSMIKSAEKSSAYFNFEAGQMTLLGLPAKYIAGKMMLVRAIQSGLDIILTKPSADNLLDSVDSEMRIDFIPMTPFQLLSSFKKTPDKFNQIDKILLGGGALTPSIKQLIPQIRSNLYHGFGMTETITHIAVKELKTNRDSLYKALSGIKFEVDDKSRLIIYADHLDEVIHTNDIVQLSGDNKFEWLSRWDNVINSGGIKLYPEQIELKLEPLIKQPFFIYQVSDERLGQRPVLFIESSENGSHNLIQNIDKTLEKFEIPDEIYFVKLFHRTPTGKIQRSVTAEEYWANN